VSDLDRSVAFYGTLLGRPPLKLHADYAKFELDEPPLVLLKDNILRYPMALSM